MEAIINFRENKKITKKKVQITWFYFQEYLCHSHYLMLDIKPKVIYRGERGSMCGRICDVYGNAKTSSPMVGNQMIIPKFEKSKCIICKHVISKCKSK